MTQARSESSNAVAVPATTVDQAGARSRWWAVILCAAILWGVLSWFLGAEWSLSEQYSYGWFVPLLAAGLFVLRWPDRPAAAAPQSHAAVSAVAMAGVIGALGALPFVRLVEIANPDWRPLGWVHAMLVAGLTLFGIWHAGGRPWLRHFAFPVFFFLVAVPWTRGFEDSVIQVLMRGVAHVAVDLVALFGVPAMAEGNLIRIGSGVVGVNEACSGVRSLQTSLMLGLLLGELNRFSVLRRLAVVAGAVGVALVANTIRATYLVWVAADRGLAAVEQQHNVIGYLILVSVFLGTLGLAAWLKGGVAPPMNSPPNRSAARFLAAPAWVFLLVAAWLAVSEIGVEAWYRWHERGLEATPRWTVVWPENAPGFRALPIAESAERILRYDEGRGANWSATGSGRPNDRALYFFRWKPGRNSAQLAADHRPDVCLPAAGLQQVADHGRRAWPVGSGRPGVVFQHYEFARRGAGRPQSLDVFYCLAEDLPRAELGFNPYVSTGGWDHLRKRIGVALAGRRNLGQQMLQVIVFDADSPADAEREFSTLLPTLLRFPGAS